MPIGIYKRKPFTVGHKRKIGLANKRKNKGKHNSPTTEFKKGHLVSGLLRKKLSELRKSNKEKNSPNWKGGITPRFQKIRQSLEYKLWRKAIFERDNYTCIWCGDNKGGNLNADHIKPFADYPELRFAIDNGRTLCKECHKKTITYGSRRI